MHTMRSIRTVLHAWLAFALVPNRSSAEPYVATTANQAVAIAPWPVWWALLLAVVLLVHIGTRWLLTSRSAARARVRAVTALTIGHVLAGIVTFAAMILASVAYVRASPWLFVAAWLATVAGSTAGYVYRACTRSAQGGVGQI